MSRNRSRGRKGSPGRHQREGTSEESPQDSRVQVSQIGFQGPIPPPALLGQYEDVIPDAPERILQMAEREQRAAIKIAKRESLIPLLGQVFAFVLFFSGLAGGLALAYLGHSLEGLTAFIGTLAAGIAVFFRATK